LYLYKLLETNKPFSPV